MASNETLSSGIDLVDDDGDIMAALPYPAKTPPRQIVREDVICSDALVRACVRNQGEPDPFQELVIDLAFGTDERFGIFAQRRPSGSS